MSTIQDLFQQAQLAEAAYANLWDADLKQPISDNEKLIAALRGPENKDFSDSQARAFVLDWQVIDHLPDTAAGFSATIFKNRHTGAYHLAIRGSTDFPDFSADAALIATDGIAVRQLVDLYNFWQRATTAEGQTYAVGRLVPYDSFGDLPLGAIPIDNYPFGIVMGDSSAQPAELRLATGKIPAGLGTVNVAGHSLGGHLAMAFTRLFPGIASNAAAVNGLGFKIGNSTVDSLFAALGGAASFTSSRIQNVYGIGGREFAAMNNGMLQQPGGWNGIYIEDDSFLLPMFRSHSSSQMTDSLAIYNLLATLDANLNGAGASGLYRITPLLEASANVADRTLENMVNALGNLFKAGTTITSAQTDQREALYARIKAIQDNQLFTQSAGLVSVRDLTQFSSTQIASIAQNNLAYRYALRELNPFAILGADYTAHNADGALDL
ncbi:hypothetical protein, partial [Sulfurisoma sediminicola]